MMTNNGINFACKDSVGTYMIFQEDKGRFILFQKFLYLSDLLEHTQVSYLCKTTKRMKVEQVSLRKKQLNNGILLTVYIYVT